MSAAADLAQALSGKANGTGFVARCPAHEDSTPSLSISETSGRLLVHCHAGCEQGAVIDVLKSRGLWPASTERSASRIVETYDYRDADGALVYQAVRLEPKSFRQRRPDGDAWAWNVRGVEPLPYRLPELIAAVKARYAVYIAEGEKDVDRLRAAGIDATCNSGGAGKWRAGFAKYFEGANVIVVPDNDAPGRAHAEQVAASLAPVAKSVRIVALPGLAEHGDVSDFLGSHDVSDLEELAAAAPIWTPSAPSSDSPTTDAPRLVFKHLADIVAERREPEWLIRHILEARVLAVIAGARGTFKSFLGLDWIMRAALASHPGVILSGEGAGLDRRADAWMRTHAPDVDLRTLPVIALERPVNLNAIEDLEAVRVAIRASRYSPGAILIDTLSKFSPGLDENDNAEVSAYLATLARGLRDEFACTVLLVAHSGHADPRRPRGAYALMANPDAEYVVERPDATAMAFTVSRERFKDSPSLPALAYAAEVVDLGRLDRYGDPVTSLVIRETGCAPPARPELRGRAQRQLLAALRAQEAGRSWTLADLREVGRQAGLTKGTARSAAEGLTFSPYMTATIGGWTLANA